MRHQHVAGVYGATRALAAAGLIAALGACPAPEGGAGSKAAADTGVAAPLGGAWRLVEIREVGASRDTSAVGLLVVAGSHYSLSYLAPNEARPPFADPLGASDADLLQAYHTFLANAGSFTLRQDTLVMRPTVAKHPNFMGGGEDRYTFEVRGDTLSLASVPGAFRWRDGTALPGGGSGSSGLLFVRSP